MTDRATARPAGRLRITVALTAILAMLGAALTAGCNRRDAHTDASSTAENDRAGGAVRLYGSDGNMINSFGAAFKDHPGLLNGMKGTIPLTPLSEDFTDRLRRIDPQLVDFSYAGESYDAVVIVALAAETARSTDGAQIARHVTAVTVARGAAGVVCDSIRRCLEAIRGGKDVAYRGVALRRGGLTDRGEPSTAMYGTVTFGRGNRIDDAKTEYVGVGDERTEAKDPAPPPAPATRPTRTANPLKVGALLPKTGDLAFAGPPLFAGIALAVADLNEAGGILGQPVQYLDGDDGTNPKVAGATVDRHIAAGVQVIVGAGGSDLTKAVLPKAIAAQRVMISPSATSDELTTLDDRGLFFRTSPPDIMQAKALADVIMRDGAERVVLIARDDSYGIGLRDNVADELRAAGVKADRIKALKYAVRDEYPIGHFTGPAAEASDFTPDGILVVGFEESANVIKALSARGMKFHD